jgi:protein TonB
MSQAADLLEPRKRTLARWIGAATLITAVHVGTGSLAMLWQAAEEIDEPAGAVVVEIAQIATAPPEDLQAPPGPPREESTATQQSSQKVEKAEEETPDQDAPSPIPDPEVTVQKRTEAKEEPKEEPKKEEARQEVKAADQQRDESRAAAPPPVNAPRAKTAAAPQVGSSDATRKSVITWQRAVVLHLNRHKRYPAAAQSRGVQGEVQVHFKMDRSGLLVSSRVVRSSGSPLLDEATLDLFKRASPLPRPPSGMAGEVIELSMPISFRMK